MNKTTQNGFTLYELLTTMLIVGVVLAAGVPNMIQFTQNSRMSSTANDLHSAFHLARSESSRAKTNITVCASASPLSENPDCDGTWDQGFIVFVDNDGLINVNGADTVLRANGPIADGLTLAVADDATYFSYSSTGIGRPNVGGNPAVTQIVMCDDRGNVTAAGGSSAARLFIATPLGRATVFRDVDLVTDALDTMGKSCP